LYKIKIDGTNKQTVIDKAGTHINILGEWAYYNSGGILYKTKLDGSITVVLSKMDRSTGTL